jgi:hypothetical protein
MNPPVLLIQSHQSEVGFDPLSPAAERGDFSAAAAGGLLRAIHDWDVTPAHIASARGIIVTMYLDQIRMMDLAAAWETFLDAGGRLVLNGHVMRPYIRGLASFVTSGSGRRIDFELTVLADHPVFTGIDRAQFQSVRGVAGFYGRGCNPLPAGASALTGVGPDKLPVDWHWRRPGGGEILAHAGNDWWGTSSDKPAMNRFAANLVAWASGETT